MYVLPLLAASGHHVFAFSMVFMPLHFRHICQMAFRFHRMLLVQAFSTVWIGMEKKRDVIYNKNDV